MKFFEKKENKKFCVFSYETNER